MSVEKIMERWEVEYDILDKKDRTPEEQEVFYKLGVRLGYITPKRNEEIECVGCGS